MGDETIRFASRFARAVDLLGRIATDRGHAALRRQLGSELDAAVMDALDAVAELHETGTEAVSHWSNQRARVLAQISEVRAALSRNGVDASVRRGALAVIDLIGGRGNAGSK